MRRALRFLLVAAVLLALAWGVGSIPGTFTARSGAYTVETSVPGAIVILAIIALLLAVSWRLLAGLRRAPGSYGSWRGARRRKQGAAALERGIVALAAGDAATAEASGAAARARAGETPLVLLLCAEAARLAGKTEQANADFARLTKLTGFAFLGHRGLARQHLAAGNQTAAAEAVVAAEAAYPGSNWTRSQRLRLALNNQDYAAAVPLAGSPLETAALAAAAANAAPAPARALRFAKQAIKAAPSYPPAVGAYVRALRKAGKNRAARRAAMRGWAAAPHPMLAEAWLENIPSALERARAAGELAASAPGHPESELLLAQTALAAQLTGEARRHANAALREGLADRRVQSVLASLDPSGPAPAAAGSAPEPVWQCAHCAAKAPHWQPVCPVCGEIGSLAWRAEPAAVPAISG